MSLRRRREMTFRLLLVATTVALVSSAWPVHDIDSDYRVGRKRELIRRSNCVNPSGRCFTTGQCCRGLVCAALDDYFGQKPEVPGYCVREKDLVVCVMQEDCEAGSKCASLGQTDERYCLPAHSPEEAKVANYNHIAPSTIRGLGSECETSSQCKSVADSTDSIPLCCQLVRRGRQGMKRQCDRVTKISVCITTPEQ